MLEGALKRQPYDRDLLSSLTFYMAQAIAPRSARIRETLRRAAIALAVGHGSSADARMFALMRSSNTVAGGKRTGTFGKTVADFGNDYAASDLQSAERRDGQQPTLAPFWFRPE